MTAHHRSRATDARVRTRRGHPLGRPRRPRALGRHLEGPRALRAPARADASSTSPASSSARPPARSRSPRTAACSSPPRAASRRSRRTARSRSVPTFSAIGATCASTTAPSTRRDASSSARLALGAETGDEVLLRVSPDGTVETLQDRHPALQRHRLLARRRHDLPRRHAREHGVAATPTAPARSISTSRGRPCSTDLPHYPDGLTVSARRQPVGRAVGRLQRPPPRALRRTARHRQRRRDPGVVPGVRRTRPQHPRDHDRAGGPRGLDRCRRARSSSPPSARPASRCRAGAAARPPPTGTHEKEAPRMRLVRLGPAGSETPGVLVDDDTFVDLSDVVGDFDETFFGSGALADPRRRRRRARRGRPHRARRRPPVRRSVRAPAPDPVHRTELQRPRRRDRPGRSGRADPVHEVAEHAHRPERRRADSPRLAQDRLGGRARHRDRPPRVVPRRRGRGGGIHRRLRARQRRQRARVADRARRPVVQGQVGADVQPGRPLPGHPRRGRRRARPRHVARRSTARAARPARPRR